MKRDKLQKNKKGLLYVSPAQILPSLFEPAIAHG